MANPSKAKGTGGETELMRLLNKHGWNFRRTSAGCVWDLEQEGKNTHMVAIDILATRPDNGEWLFTTDLTGIGLGIIATAPVRIEVKRYRRFALHTIWVSKFRRKA